MAALSAVSLRTTLAVASGKLAGLATRVAGRGGGTALPGLIATRIDPHLIERLAGQIPLGSTIVSATNGKTTTARLLSAIATTAGIETVANRAGSNLLRGIASTLLAAAGPNGRLDERRAALGVFELDENIVPAALPLLRPRAITLGNLFRDQLDRFGEVDLIADRWRAMLADAPDDLTICLNADDPVVAALGRAPGAARVLYYGLDDPRHGTPQLEHAADSKWCPECGRPFHYEFAYYAHLGAYACPVGHLCRPRPDIAAHAIELDGLSGTRFEVAAPDRTFAVSLPIPGLFNVYNALAAIAVALAVGCPVEAIEAGLSGASAAFGRLENVEIAGRRVWLLLSKNPTGFNAALRTVFSGAAARNCLLVLNDNIADGRDISWIWDVDFEPYADRFGRLVVSGTRAADLSLRLKYAFAGLETEEGPPVERDLGKALDRVIGETPTGADLFVLATYTAMLEVQELLARRGVLPPYWSRA